MLANVQRVMIMPTVHALFLFFFCSVLIHVLSTTRGHIDDGRNCAKSFINRINEDFFTKDSQSKMISFSLSQKN